MSSKAVIHRDSDDKLKFYIEYEKYQKLVQQCRSKRLLDKQWEKLYTTINECHNWFVDFHGEIHGEDIGPCYKYSPPPHEKEQIKIDVDNCIASGVDILQVFKIITENKLQRHEQFEKERIEAEVLSIKDCINYRVNECKQGIQKHEDLLNTIEQQLLTDVNNESLINQKHAETCKIIHWQHLLAKVLEEPYGFTLNYRIIAKLINEKLAPYKRSFSSLYLYMKRIQNNCDKIKEVYDIKNAYEQNTPVDKNFIDQYLDESERLKYYDCKYIEEIMAEWGGKFYTYYQYVTEILMWCSKYESSIVYCKKHSKCFSKYWEFYKDDYGTFVKYLRQYSDTEAYEMYMKDIRS